MLLYPGWRRSFRLAAALLLLATPALAQRRPPPPAASPATPAAPATTPGRPPLPRPATTHHQIALPGRSLSFIATAGALALRDDAGKTLAQVPFTAYRLDGAEPAGRPVAFVFNGGPGAASAWLQLGTIGPWRLALDGASPSSPPALLPNAQTWLDFTDLVFLDPPGTGFGRIEATGEAAKPLWSVEGDVDGLARIIRAWLRRFGREASPKYIVGESYGGLRGPRLVRALNREGTGITGLVLISPALDMGDFGPAAQALDVAGLLPSLVAIGRAAHGPVAEADLADAEAYAAGAYVVDLLKGDADAAAVARRSEAVAKLTGLDPAYVLRRAGRLSRAAFNQARGGDTVGSPYDGTLLAASPDPTQPWLAAPDPINDGLAAPVTEGATLLYRMLDWLPQGRYVLGNARALRQWDYGHHGMPESLTALRQDLANDALLRVLVVHGLYDTVTPYFRTKLMLAQLPPKLVADRLRLLLLPGGHMVYLREAPRIALRSAAEAVFAPEKTAGSAPGTP